MENQIFHVGDKVFDIRYGWGKVTTVGNDIYPIIVTYEDQVASYTTGGKSLINHNHPFLSFTEYTLKDFSQERPWQPKKGEAVMVKDFHNTEWLLQIFSHSEDNEHYAWNEGMDLSGWDQIKKPTF